MDDRTPVIIGVGEASEKIEDAGFSNSLGAGYPARRARAAERDGGRMTLARRTALVTGASSGLARRLAEAGARVVVAARRRERLDALAAEIEAKGGEALAVAADVTDEAALQAVFDAAETRFGVIDTVYANAGMSNEGRSVDIPIEAFDEVMNVNTRAVFLTAREAAKRLNAAGPEARREAGSCWWPPSAG